MRCVKDKKTFDSSLTTFSCALAFERSPHAVDEAAFVTRSNLNAGTKSTQCGTNADSREMRRTSFSDVRSTILIVLSCNALNKYFRLH